MTSLSRGLAFAGLAMASGDAGAGTPARLWRSATHFTLACAVTGMDDHAAAALCKLLAPDAAHALGLPWRASGDPTGVVLHLTLHSKDGRSTGTLFASRTAFEDETDERSPTVSVAFANAAPGAGMATAIAQLRGNQPRNLPHRSLVRPIA